MPELPVINPFLLFAAALVLDGVLLYLWVATKIDLWRYKRSAKEQLEAVQARCSQLEDAIAKMESTLREAEERSAVLVAPPSARSGLNLNKRIQAARMSKRGERPEQIASALGLPRNEVALLLKVQQMTLPN